MTATLIARNKSGSAASHGQCQGEQSSAALAPCLWGFVGHLNHSLLRRHPQGQWIGPCLADGSSLHRNSRSAHLQTARSLELSLSPTPEFGRNQFQPAGWSLQTDHSHHPEMLSWHVRTPGMLGYLLSTDLLLRTFVQRPLARISGLLLFATSGLAFIEASSEILAGSLLCSLWWRPPDDGQWCSPRFCWGSLHSARWNSCSRRRFWLCSGGGVSEAA
jgi:hypothetical protein